jgi:hypothetical protein
VWRDRVALSILITRNTNSEPSHGLDRQGGGSRIGQHRLRTSVVTLTSLSGADIRCVSIPSVAHPSSDGLPSWPSGDRRKTMFIPIGALFNEVGPGVALAADTFRARQLHDEYTESPESMALLRGALGMMKVTISSRSPAKTSS